MRPDSLTYEVAFPGATLQHYVSHFWQSRWATGVQDHFVYHSTANTNTELAFAFRPRNRHGHEPVFSAVQGHTDSHSRIDTGGFSEMFGVSIHSYAIPFFFDIPSAQLANHVIDLAELPGANAAFLAKSLAAGRSFSQRMAIMTAYLEKRLRRGHEDQTILHAIRKMKNMRGLVSIRELAAECALSQKQFERRFREFSSFNPKLYARILRFESSLSAYKKLDSLTALAHHLGYYDQAHFINDFRQFSGFSPRQYMAVMPY
ncbi:AraC family transcriptional regulator [Chitinophaga sp.]|uniref:AraC family transcriptional regulator n=1 Tax=Chitinophaga sp. TaxID=1869181 RepID=UPI0031DB81DC